MNNKNDNDNNNKQEAMVLEEKGEKNPKKKTYLIQNECDIPDLALDSSSFTFRETLSSAATDTHNADSRKGKKEQGAKRAAHSSRFRF
jgi:hypothetical protein